MKRLVCVRIENLLNERAAGLSESQRLLVEEHIGYCVECRRDAQLLGGVQTLVDSVSPRPLSDTALERTITNAITGVGIRVALPPPRAARSVLWGGLAVAAAAGAIFAVVVPGETPPSRARPTVAEIEPAAADLKPTPAVGDRVLRGEVEVDGSPQTQIPANAMIATSKGATIALANARVGMTPSTKARWIAPRSTIELDSGRLAVTVEHRAGRRFRVATARFTVEVVGTEFEVDSDSVRVSDGVVRVFDPSGEVLVDGLGAGSHWAYEPPTKLDPAPAATGTRVNAGRLLAKARAQLATRDVAGARRSIERALRGISSRSARAEAQTLLAECALVAGDREQASRLYLRVARRFADLPAGEIALFAGARLESDLEHSGRGQHLLRRYIERYPQGRFVKQVNSRISQHNVE